MTAVKGAVVLDFGMMTRLILLILWLAGFAT